MTEPISLSPSTIVDDHPFTHPLHSLADLELLHCSLDRLRALLPINKNHSTNSPLARTEFVDGEQRHHRIILNQRFDLSRLSPVELVGFFGHRRQQADQVALAAIDEELLAELHDHVDVLCYFTSQLGSGDYGNLVLFRTAVAKEQWMNSTRHAWAVRYLAPDCYHTIRLHNGVLPETLAANTAPFLTCTKYFDFDVGAENGVPWRAIRHYSPPLTLQI